MDNTQDKPTSTKKRILEPQVESGSKKERKRLKKGKAESEVEAESEKNTLRRLRSSRARDRN